MKDTIASLNKELEVLGSVDYSTSNRQCREDLINRLAILAMPETNRNEIAMRAERTEYVELVRSIYNEASIYGSSAPYALCVEAQNDYDDNCAGDRNDARRLVGNYLTANPE